MIFTVIVTREAAPGALKQLLDTRFSGDHILVTKDTWLVSGKGPAQNMSDQLGISDGSVANGVVASMGSYFGRAPSNIWDWIKAKLEEASSNE